MSTSSFHTLLLKVRTVYIRDNCQDQVRLVIDKGNERQSMGIIDPEIKLKLIGFEH